MAIGDIVNINKVTSAVDVSRQFSGEKIEDQFAYGVRFDISPTHGRRRQYGDYRKPARGVSPNFKFGGIFRPLIIRTHLPEIETKFLASWILSTVAAYSGNSAGIDYLVNARSQCSSHNIFGALYVDAIEFLPLVGRRPERYHGGSMIHVRAALHSALYRIGIGDVPNGLLQVESL